VRYNDQSEQAKLKAKMSRTPLPLAKDYVAMNHNEPITTYKRWLVAFSKTCEITGERIPALSIAYKKEIDYLIRDEIHTDVTWVSERGYILEKLKGNA